MNENRKYVNKQDLTFLAKEIRKKRDTTKLIFLIKHNLSFEQAKFLLSEVIR